MKTVYPNKSPRERRESLLDEKRASSCTVDSIVGIQVGDRVQCYVYVCGEAVPMHQGIVTELRDGYYMVDRMSLHGGRPWIVAERHVTKVDAN